MNLVDKEIVFLREYIVECDLWEDTKNSLEPNMPKYSNSNL